MYLFSRILNIFLKIHPSYPRRAIGTSIDTKAMKNTGTVVTLKKEESMHKHNKTINRAGASMKMSI